MNRLSFAFISSLVVACAGESGQQRTVEAAPTDVPPSVLSPRPGSEVIDPGCLPPASTVRNYGTSGEDRFSDVVITADGDVLVAGHQRAMGVVFAYDQMFTPRAVVDTPGTDTVASLAIAPDTGRVWLAVRSDGLMPGLTSYGGFDVVLAALDDNGARPLVRGYGTGPEHPHQITAATGMVAIAGDVEFPAADGSTWVNPFVSVYDTIEEEPSTLWFLTRRSNPIETYTAVEMDERSIVLAGAIATGAEEGTFVLARTRDGDFEWQQRLSVIGGDTVAAIRIVDGGDIVWAGTSAGDIVAGRIDRATGVPRWTVRHGDTHDERVADLAVDDAGHLYITGDLAIDEGAQRDAFLLVLDDQGQPLAEEAWTSDGDDVPAAIAVDACGTAVIVGHTTGDLGGEPHGGDDGFLVVTSTASTISE